MLGVCELFEHFYISKLIYWTLNMTSIKDIQELTNFDHLVRLLFQLHIIWSIYSKENHENGCHQRPNFMRPKMH